MTTTAETTASALFLTQDIIDAYGHFAHDVRSRLQADYKLKESKAFELVGRYPTMLLLVFSQGADVQRAANLIMLRAPTKRGKR